MRRGREKIRSAPSVDSDVPARGPVGQYRRARAGAKSDRSIHGAREIGHFEAVPPPAGAVMILPVASTAPPRSAERLTRSTREGRPVSVRSFAGADNPNLFPESVMPQILLRGLLGDASPRRQGALCPFRRDSASGTVVERYFACASDAPSRWAVSPRRTSSSRSTFGSGGGDSFPAGAFR